VKGNFTYGDGSATIATLHRDIVERCRWLAEEPFQLSYAPSRLTPGTNLLAFSACVGYLLRRTPGVVVAPDRRVVAMCGYGAWPHRPLRHLEPLRRCAGGHQGSLAAAVAVTVMRGVTLIRPHWRSAGRAKLMVFVGGGFVAAQFLRLSPLLVLVLAAAGGLIWPVRRPS
jgi:chromate transporter